MLSNKVLMEEPRFFMAVLGALQVTIASGILQAKFIDVKIYFKSIRIGLARMKFSMAPEGFAAIVAAWNQLYDDFGVSR